MTFARRLFAKLILRLHRMRRGMTLGVRALLINDDDQVFLVKHTYMPGWYLPGGGVEPGETFHDALVKEVREECNLALTDEGILLAILQNARVSKRDHVALYHCPSFEVIGPPDVPNREIQDAKFFPIRDLPTDASPATVKRIREFLNQGPYPEIW